MANILPVQLPPIPQDSSVLPNPPAFPDDTIQAIQYLRDINLSRNKRPYGQNRSIDNFTAAERCKHAVIDHAIIDQAVALAAVTPPLQAAPPWFTPAMCEAMCLLMPPLLAPLYADIHRVLALLANQMDGNGQVPDFEVKLFTDGSDPTVAPHALPPLISFENIFALNPQDVRAYLNGYGIPIPANPNPVVADNLCKDALKKAVSGRYHIDI